MHKYLAIGLGGSMSAILRYLFKTYPQNLTDFPFGIFLINIVGSMLLSFFLTLTFAYKGIGPNIKTGIATGFLGALTTFSAFSKDRVFLIIQGDYLLALGYVFCFVTLGLILAILASWRHGRSFSGGVPNDVSFGWDWRCPR